MKFILYILKRIIIGVSIVLSVSFIKGLIVNADTISEKFLVSPNSINYYWTGGNIGSCTSFTTNTIGIYTFYTCTSPLSQVPTNVRALYSSNQFISVVNSSKAYSLFFVLYMSSTTIRTINSVTVDSASYNYSCNVLSNDSYSVNSNNVIYAIYCPSVVMNGGNMYVNANFDSDSLTSTSGQFTWGVSQFFTFVDNNDNSAVVSAIDSLRSSITSQSTQAHNDSVATQEKIDNVNDTLNDNTTDNPQSSFDSFNSNLPSNNTISNLITLPVQLFQKILNSLSSSCSPFNLGNLMGTDLTLPCINIANYIGSTLWSVIDILFSGFFVLVIGRKMIKAFENFSSMKEGDVLND